MGSKLKSKVCKKKVQRIPNLMKESMKKRLKVNKISFEIEKHDCQAYPKPPVFEPPILFIRAVQFKRQDKMQRR